jgi:uncharacterized membrane protein
MISTRLSLTSMWLWPTIVLLGLVTLIAFPGGFVDKSRMVMHGLCAQTPSHTFTLGGQPLPFDARMTGIYSGALATLSFLAIRGRLLALHLPSPRLLAFFALLVVAMTADGFNSLFTDLGWWHPWESTNLLRLITGYGMGMAIAVALVWLVGGTLFHLADRRPSIDSWRDVEYCLLPLPVMLLALRSEASWLHVPISLLLMLSAWIVLATLALVTLLLATRHDERVMRIGQLHLPGAVGLVVGLAIMLVLAFGRAWLERTLGIPSTL